MIIALIAGARPNFIKAAPLWLAMQRVPEIKTQLIHTGQHQDAAMSTAFLNELGLPEPDVYLPRRRTTGIRETTRMVRDLKPVLNKIRPDWVVVIGDVNSTLAGTLAAKQLGLRVAHVEAGLRSGDLDMPEERNRIQVDHLADLLFAGEASGVKNLKREGIAPERIYFPGNVLIDALHAVLPQAKTLIPGGVVTRALIANPGRRLPADFALCTFHRPSNVDNPAGLQKIVNLLLATGRHLPVIFPVHPRTMQSLRKHGLAGRLLSDPSIWALRPLGYAEIICLCRNARFVVTDSGGLQEESSCLQVPCLTFRRSTERPATVDYGANTVISDLEIQTVEAQIEVLLAGKYKTGTVPPLWDGRAAGRIVQTLRTSPPRHSDTTYLNLSTWKK